MTITSKKVVAAVVGFGLALSVFGIVGLSTAGAQAMTLSQLVDLFISLGIISPEKAAQAKSAVSSSATAATFTRDLTVGSSGADVTALQTKLGVSPASGYFGSITKAAVQSYQTANGVPSTGYVGQLTRAKLNGSVAASGSTTVSTTPVVNSGVEGTLTVDKSSVSNSTAREGDSMKPVLGLKVEAKLSDVNVQRLKVDLGQTTTVYTKVFKTFYLVDDSGKVLAQADLNSNTVVKESSNYYLTLGGFSYTVPKDTTKYLWLKADLYSAIKVADQTARTITVPVNGVRGVDGAGIDQYSPSTSFNQSITINGTLIDSASLKLSTNSNNVKTSDVVAADGTDDDEVDGVTVLIFDLKAEKDNVTVTDLAATVAKTGTGAATATKAYLYDGSTMIDSEDINSSTGVVTFDDIDVVVAKDGASKVLTLKVDIRDANGTASNIAATIASNQVTSENSEGSTVTASGSATGETMVVRNTGVSIALVGTPSISKGTTPEQNNVSTSTLTAVFNVKLKAIGNDVYFGTQAASTTFAFQTYVGGVATTVLAASSTSWSVPSSGVVTAGLTANQAFILQENNEVTVPVTFIMEGRTA
ncbi:MAG: peptidoglycan-binding domain-containing protein, partial [Candidatus Paceibacterota bacterium]